MTNGEGDANAEQKQLLMGDGATEMNLESVRKRAIELQTQISQLLARFQAQQATFTFDALLSEFAVVNNQFSQLQAELRPQLQYYVAHPLHLTPGNHLLVAEQLASMVLPDMAVADDELLMQQACRPQDDAAAKTALVGNEAVSQRHNTQIDRLLGSTGILGSKGAARKQMTAEFAALHNELMHLQRDKQLPRASTGAGAGQVTAEHPSVAAVIAALRSGHV